VNKYLTKLRFNLWDFASIHNATLEPLTVSISRNGVGEIYLPSRQFYERINPQSPPAGLIFPDGSFLTFHESVRFGYRDEDATEPTIYSDVYGIHFQSPRHFLFFRFDYHPDVGNQATHPLYHLYCGPCLPDATKLPSVPRFKVDDLF